MKRGLISWDKSELPPEVFDRRLAEARAILGEKQLEALGVYSDLWKSNQARFFSNYMPYFNRALLVIPTEGEPTLLCGLSPRVYGWIRSVTVIEDVRPAPHFQKALLQLVTERGWKRIGMLDFDQFPEDLHSALCGSSLELVDVPSVEVYRPGDDPAELAVRRKAVEMAREILEKEISKGPGGIDHHFVGRLERQFRRLGAEDLVVLVTNGSTPPGPPAGVVLEENFSVSIALEYRGHWVRLTRAHGNHDFRQAAGVHTENLCGSYPYEYGDGAIRYAGRHIDLNGKRLFHGDTIL